MDKPLFFFNVLNFACYVPFPQTVPACRCRSLDTPRASERAGEHWAQREGVGWEEGSTRSSLDPPPAQPRGRWPPKKAPGGQPVSPSTPEPPSRSVAAASSECGRHCCVFVVVSCSPSSWRSSVPGWGRSSWAPCLQSGRQSARVSSDTWQRIGRMDDASVCTRRGRPTLGYRAIRSHSPPRLCPYWRQMLAAVLSIVDQRGVGWRDRSHTCGCCSLYLWAWKHGVSGLRVAHRGPLVDKSRQRLEGARDPCAGRPGNGKGWLELVVRFCARWREARFRSRAEIWTFWAKESVGIQSLVPARRKIGSRWAYPWQAGSWPGRRERGAIITAPVCK